MPRSPRTRRLSAALVLAAAAGCAPPPAAAPDTPGKLPTVTVTVAPVQLRAVPRTVATVGTLNGYDEVTLAPKVDGRVNVIAADVGDVAVPGAVLMELDPTDYHLAAEEARRGLDAELARLGLDALPDGPVDLEAVPGVNKATVALANTRVRFNRTKDLFARQATSQDDFQSSETEVKLAEATKRDAVAQARATLASARLRKAALDTAGQKIEDCRLRAPVPPGWPAWAAAVGPGFAPLRYAVAQRMLSEGEMVRAMPVTNAYKLVIDHALKLRAAVPERFAADVHVGQAVEVRVDAHPDAVFPGTVARVNPTVDPLNRTFQVEAAVPNLDGRLKCGGFARAAVKVKVDAGVRTVPPAAVVTFAGVTKVFVADAGVARAVPVRVGLREREWAEVDGDLPPAATVVVSGLSQVVDGSPVRVRQ